MFSMGLSPRRPVWLEGTLNQFSAPIYWLIRTAFSATISFQAKRRSGGNRYARDDELQCVQMNRSDDWTDRPS